MPRQTMDICNNCNTSYVDNIKILPIQRQAGTLANGFVQPSMHGLPGFLIKYSSKCDQHMWYISISWGGWVCFFFFLHWLSSVFWVWKILKKTHKELIVHSWFSAITENPRGRTVTANHRLIVHYIKYIIPDIRWIDLKTEYDEDISTRAHDPN